MVTRASEVTETCSVPLFVLKQTSEVVETAPSTASNLPDIVGLERPHRERCGWQGGLLHMSILLLEGIGNSVYL